MKFGRLWALFFLRNVEKGVKGVKNFFWASFCGVKILYITALTPQAEKKKNPNSNVNNSTSTVNNYIGCQNTHNVDIHDNNINNGDTEEDVYSVDDDNEIKRRKTRRGKQKNRMSRNLRTKDRKS